MSQGRRNFNNLPPLERHRRLVSCHFGEPDNGTRAASSSGNEELGFFSPQEEKEIQQQHRQKSFENFYLLRCIIGWFPRFIRSNDDIVMGTDTWATRLAKKYYQRLFKEYCIVDLSLYEYGCLGTRWRTEQEVKEGKGQFTCASTQCKLKESLGTYEINFSYSESGVKKQALVKVRLCPECTRKMNYKRTVLKEKVTSVLQRNSKKRGTDHGRTVERAAKKKKISKKNTKQTSDNGGQDRYAPDFDSHSSDDCLDDLFM